mgnify:CR=1 FL=1
MKTALTIRNLPQEVARLVQRKASREGLSLNQAVRRLLEQALGAPAGRPSALSHDLDALAGSWTAEEAGAFEQALAEQRGVDRELWR